MGWGGREWGTRYCLISFSAPIPLTEIPWRHVNLKRDFSSKSSQRSHESLFNTFRWHLVQVLSGAHQTNSHRINRCFTTVKSKGGKTSWVSLVHLLLYQCKVGFFLFWPFPRCICLVFSCCFVLKFPSDPRYIFQTSRAISIPYLGIKRFPLPTPLHCYLAEQVLAYLPFTIRTTASQNHSTSALHLTKNFYIWALSLLSHVILMIIHTVAHQYSFTVLVPCWPQK